MMECVNCSWDIDAFLKERWTNETARSHECGMCFPENQNQRTHICIDSFAESACIKQMNDADNTCYLDRYYALRYDYNVVFVNVTWVSSLECSLISFCGQNLNWGILNIKLYSKMLAFGETNSRRNGAQMIVQHVFEASNDWFENDFESVLCCESNSNNQIQKSQTNWAEILISF